MHLRRNFWSTLTANLDHIPRLLGVSEPIRHEDPAEVGQHNSVHYDDDNYNDDDDNEHVRGEWKHASYGYGYGDANASTGNPRPADQR